MNGDCHEYLESPIKFEEILKIYFHLLLTFQYLNKNGFFLEEMNFSDIFVDLRFKNEIKIS